jgi:2-phospho-L-lactate/phosphoenolpyruvate guanylyltransferase
MRPELVVIPAKGLATAKSRLMDVLVPEARQALNRAQLIQTVRAASEAFGFESTYVVSPCDGVEQAVRTEGVGFVRERVPPGLNQALEQARAELIGRRRGGALCVLPVDLPLVTGQLLRELLVRCEEHRALIVPDRAGDGTNFLRLPAGCEIPFSYGPGSFAQHVGLLKLAGWPTEIVMDTCLRDDLDQARDLWLHEGYRELLAARPRWLLQ